MNLVIDTNVFISALIKENSVARKIARKSELNFLFPEFEFQEIYKHKEDLLNKSGYSEIEFIQATSYLLRHMRIVRFFEICDYLTEARAIIGKIDPDDSIFIATALAFNCPIWSDDKHFKKQNKVKIITTKDMLGLTR
jgi:predicted nucleic acid-binding protein